MRFFARATLFGLLAISQVAFAGDPCKQVETVEDAFGGSARYRMLYIGIGGYLAIGLAESEGKTWLKTLWVRSGALDVVAPVGTVGKLALEDGTVIELVSAAESVPVANVNGGGVFTQWLLDFEMDAAGLASMSRSPVVAVRTEFGGSTLSFDVPKKKGKKLLAVATCLAQ